MKSRVAKCYYIFFSEMLTSHYGNDFSFFSYRTLSHLQAQRGIYLWEKCELLSFLYQAHIVGERSLTVVKRFQQFKSRMNIFTFDTLKKKFHLATLWFIRKYVDRWWIISILSSVQQSIPGKKRLQHNIVSGRLLLCINYQTEVDNNIYYIMTSLFTPRCVVLHVFMI